MADFFAKGNKPINGYGGGNLASKSDLTNVFQTGSTATQAISAGTLFYLNGTLVRAKVDIANGATFTENTNYEVTTVGDNLISGDIEEVLSIVSSTGSKTTSKNMSNYKFLVFALRGTTSGSWGIFHMIPYKLFKLFNNTNMAVQVEFASSSVIATVHYVDDTHISVNALTSNRGFTVWGVK